MLFNFGTRSRDWIWNLWLSALSCRWLAKLSGPASRVQLCDYRLRDFCDVFLERPFHDLFSMFTLLLAPFSSSSLWSHQPHFRGSATNGSISVVCFTSCAKCQAFDSVLICFRKSSSHEIPSCRLITSGDLVEHVGILTMLYMATYLSAAVHNWTFAFSAAEYMRRDCPHQALHSFLESMMNHDALRIGGSRPSFVDFLIGLQPLFVKFHQGDSCDLMHSGAARCFFFFCCAICAVFLTRIRFSSISFDPVLSS